MPDVSQNPRNFLPGTVLLLAVLVMAAVITTSIGLGALIMSSLRQARAIDNSIMAYYAAETGVEQALYQARRQGTLPDAVSTPLLLSNNASWSRTVVGSELVVFTTIPEDSFVHLDLFDAEDESVVTGIDRVHVEWDPDPVSLILGSLRATAVPWTPGATFNWDQNAVTTNFAGGDIDIPLDSSKLYSLRLRAMSATLANVRIEAFAGTESAPIPGRIVIGATGEFGTTRQRLTVTLPRRAPLSGIYDFVIFSECSLVKGGTISCP